MKVYVILVTLLFAISSCKEEQKPLEVMPGQTESDFVKQLINRPLMENGKYVFLSAGFPDFGYYCAVDSLSNKWKIVYNNLGCSLYKGLPEAIDEHNKEVELLAEKEFGKGWKRKYEQEIKLIVEKQNLYKVK